MSIMFFFKFDTKKVGQIIAAEESIGTWTELKGQNGCYAGVFSFLFNT